MTAYATARDLYTYGLRRGVLVNEGRECASVSASTDLLELAGHQFETDDRVRVRAVAGGTLSAPLDSTAVYYVIRISDSTFKIAATAGGAAISLCPPDSEVPRGATVALRGPEVAHLEEALVVAMNTGRWEP